MDLFFLTGNRDKLREVQACLPGVQGMELDVPEIQELDATKIIRAKLEVAQQFCTGSFIVEDTSLSLEALNGFPGPLVKWLLQAIGAEGIYQLSQTLKNARATARTFIGYAQNTGEIAFFEGALSGIIVSPRGTNGFGWDTIFQPDHFSKTFAEMTSEEKYRVSMRRIALQQLQAYRATCL